MASISKGKGKGKSSSLPDNMADLFITRAEDIADEIVHGELDNKSESAVACPLEEESQTTQDQEVITTATVGTEELIGNFEAVVVPKGKQEFRSRRVQCVFTPSLYSELKAAADEDNLSVNDVINQLVTSYVKNRKRNK